MFDKYVALGKKTKFPNVNIYDGFAENYVPKLNGRNLKAQVTGVLGLFLGAIRGPYYGEL